MAKSWVWISTIQLDIYRFQSLDCRAALITKPIEWIRKSGAGVHLALPRGQRALALADPRREERGGEADGGERREHLGVRVGAQGVAVVPPRAGQDHGLLRGRRGGAGVGTGMLDRVWVSQPVTHQTPE